MSGRESGDEYRPITATTPMGREEDEIRFALGVIDDHRRLIAVGKTHRWDTVKWAVTVNIALAGASVTLAHHWNVRLLFAFFAGGVVGLSIWLLAEITRRMTETRNDSLVPLRFLEKQGVDFVRLTGTELPKNYEPNYDWQSLRIYVAILLASAVPALCCLLF